MATQGTQHRVIVVHINGHIQVLAGQRQLKDLAAQSLRPRILALGLPTALQHGHEA